MDSGRFIRVNTGEAVYSKDVLLGKYLSETISHVFTSTGVFRLLAFGLSGNDKVEVLRVWRPASSGERDECGDLLPGGEQLEMPFMVGCRPVVLDASRPELVIDASGDFAVRYVGDYRPNIQVVKMSERISVVNDTLRGACMCCTERDNAPAPPDNSQPPAPSPEPPTPPLVVPPVNPAPAPDTPPIEPPISPFEPGGQG